MSTDSVATIVKKSSSVDFFCYLSMHRRRMLGDVTSLPPLVSTPRMISVGDASEKNDILENGVARVNPITQLVETP